MKYTDPDGRILLPILNSEKKNIRKNKNRNNKEYRVGSNIDDWKSDKFGRQILLHYLFGNGKELICNSKKWGDYMRANSSLGLQI